MQPAPSYCEKIEHEFDIFVKTVLRNGKFNFIRNEKRRRNKEVLFCELEDWQINEFENLGVYDELDFMHGEYEVLNTSIVIRNETLYEALSNLESAHRNIILMFFWLDMNDREIAEAIGFNRNYVNRIRNSLYTRLKKIMEEQKNGQKK